MIALKFGRNVPGFHHLVLVPALLFTWGERHGCALTLYWLQWGVSLQVCRS